MQQNKYHQAVERIAVPQELKDKTRSMLVAGVVERSKRKRIWTIGSFSILAAAFVLIIGVSVWATGGLGNGSGGIFSGFGGLDNDEPSVAEQDMELNFIYISEETPPIRLANMYPLRSNMPLDELPDALPAEIPGGFAAPAGQITAYFSEPSDIPDAVLGEAVYHALDGFFERGGAVLTVVFTDTSILYLPVEIGGSHIGDVSVGVGFLESEDKYVAAFEKNEFTYLLTAEGISRQEFTQVLVHFVTG